MKILEFNPLTCPLSGKNLIEASAGTGKTYNITALYLRLLVEKEFDVGDILVVTFTEAATNELKERIRNLLLRAKSNFLNSERANCEDAFLTEYIKTFKQRNSFKNAINCLERAIQNFDEAAIYTIHGFCHRVLHDFTFESQALFDVELVIEQNELLLEIVEDFWRRHLYNESDLFVKYSMEKISPQNFYNLVSGKVGLHELQILPEIELPDCRGAENKFLDSYQILQEMWQASPTEIEKLFKGLNGGIKNINAKLETLELYLQQGPFLPVPKDLISIANCHVNHPFIQVCKTHNEQGTELEDLYVQKLIALKRQAFTFVKDELAKRKHEKNIYYFDDLLLKVHAALVQDNSNLAGQIRKKYKAALIDEFQDTDPVQYEIFKRIFDHPDCTLFLIGDPKQAIYGFRAADIFAYIRAKKEMTEAYTLKKNYRSDPELVQAVNSIFKKSQNPFIFKEIPFIPIESAKKTVSDQEGFHIEDEMAPPFKIWFIDARQYVDSNKPDTHYLNKDEAYSLISKAVASEIARLLQLGREGKAKLEGRPLEEKDMAILVRSHREANFMQEALRAVNVHSVLYTTESLFESDETMEMERILMAILQPKDESLLLAALATDILGQNASDIFQLTQNEVSLEAWFDKFLEYHTLWREHGFMRMFKQMLTQEKILPRLMRYPNGERRCTNLLHLAEVLHEAEIRQKLSPTSLVKWLAEHRDTHGFPSQEHQLRLESDEKAVKILTIHTSKGLEFPIVFCPFSWSTVNVSKNKDYLEFHDPANEHIFTLQLDKSKDKDFYKKLAGNEQLAEDVRLLYVAVTRAKHRCYLVWGHLSRDYHKSAMAYILHPPEPLDEQDIVESLKKHMKDRDLQEELRQLSEKSGSTIQILELPRQRFTLKKYQSASEQLHCRQFTAKIDTSQRIASYSGLIARYPHYEELADYDAFIQPSTIPKPSEVISEETDYSSILHFPRGARAGTFIHSLLQSIDFLGTAEDFEKIISRKLHEFGFENNWLSAVRSMVVKVLSARLNKNKESFDLKQIPMEKRLNELEFYFPIHRLEARALKDIFAHYAGIEIPSDFPGQLEKVNFASFHGFMKGYIDLVFQHKDKYYIVDWKTNYLGPEVSDYSREAMETAMVENLYILQYHIYTLALHRYLSLRLPDYQYDRHFGGVFYLFVRGIDPDVGVEYGIFQARPSKQIITELTDSITLSKS
ncbi:MAG: exodeoxyribonuclease V subunit beta [Calditrichaeota bacterium]|nr:MAG: exodeoxyribonuclease V subunit beta [Calditrichota bacterium]